MATTSDTVTAPSGVPIPKNPLAQGRPRTDYRQPPSDLRRPDLNRIRYAEPQEESWSWEGWGYRSEREWLLVARNLEMVNAAGVGALMGTTLAAVPAFFLGFSDYPFVFAQPLGALVGAVAGNSLILYRWLNKRNFWHPNQSRSSHS
ncbi:MAG: hypothetical protein HYU29_08340 [Chloroflexi bacterium]|nr:hypothetical protein [Chloroflexota bacterium]